MRKITRHEDEECTYEKALEIMNQLSLEVIHKSFNTIFSLPLSGGYVGLNFVPQIQFVYKTILTTERFFEKFIHNNYVNCHRKSLLLDHQR